MAGPKPLDPADVKYIAIHCSATPGDRDIGVKEIDRMHRERGFRCIGYHFVVRRDGTVEAGRKLTEPGAHVENFNSSSIGICLVGGVDSKLKPEANFTNNQMAYLDVLLEKLRKQFPNAVVQGHRDFPNVNKACPSFDVKHWLATAEVKA
jgi:N-acetylmuramoyl-L-alanine amidase